MNKDFIKKNILKNYVNKKGFKIKKDYFNYLNKEIEIIIEKSINRADKNFRTTIMSKDL